MSKQTKDDGATTVTGVSGGSGTGMLNGVHPISLDPKVKLPSITVSIEKTLQEVQYNPIKVSVSYTTDLFLGSDPGEAAAALSGKIQDALDEIIAERRTTRCPFCYTFGADFDERTKCDDCPKETNDACRKASKPSGRR